MSEPRESETAEEATGDGASASAAVGTVSETSPGDADDRADDEVGRRRTFAIISHPDAGKTTMTEKLLLYGGAIRLAGTVKARRARRHATSDWMEVERERGISVTSSVLQFDWNGRRLNLLDTPGHQDFSEDTFRTLTAADSAVMLLDNRRGVEAQTRKLFDVCRMRRLPIFTFVNKCDRVGVDPLGLIDDVEADLGIRCAPVTWPILAGPGETDCLGVYDRRTGMLHPFVRSEDHGTTIGPDESVPLDSDEAGERFPEAALVRLREEAALLDVAAADLDEEGIRSAEISPTFFGSALLNFGVEPFLESFLEHAPPPGSWPADDPVVDPREPTFRGFVFKIQANMDPKHRDRIAFVRICSGRWEPGLTATNLRTGKETRLASARRFLARDREMVEEAVAGDVVGIHDRGSLRIGDNLSEDGGPPMADVPRFSPEHFARVSPNTAFGRKHLDRGLQELSQEGVVHALYERTSGSAPRPMVGVVGRLQFDVLRHRLEHEYGVEARLEQLHYVAARWVVGDEEEIRSIAGSYRSTLAYDHQDRPLILFGSEFALRKANETAEENPGLQLHAVSP